MATDPAAHPPLTERYLLGELSDSERAEFEAHYFQCPTCADDVIAGSAFVQNARAVLIADRARTAEPAAAPEETRRALDAATAAAPQQTRPRARDRAIGAAPAETRPRAPDAAVASGWLRRLFEGDGFAAWGLRAAAVGVLPLLGVIAFQRLHTIPQLQQEVALRDAPRAIAPVPLRPPTRGAPIAITVGPADRSIMLALELPASAEGAPALHARVLDHTGRPVLPTFPVPRPLPGEPLYLTVPAAPLTTGSHELVIQIDTAELARYPFTVERR